MFKLIRDRFAFPKDAVREEVMAKYHLVFHHDRAGRLIDAQEFRFLRFPRARFAPALLDELLGECRDSAYAEGDDIVVAHCYVERRLRPLDLYVRETMPDARRRRRSSTTARRSRIWRATTSSRATCCSRISA